MRLASFAMLLMILVAGGCQPSVSPEVESLAQQIRQAGRVEDSNIGYAATPSTIYEAYAAMRDAASQQELERLLDDRSPAVRVYAFQGLDDKSPEVDLFPLLMAHLGDSVQVTSQFGCIGGRYLVPDLMIMQVEKKLTTKQKEELFTWLINHPNTLEARARALDSWPLLPQYHAAIRKLAETGAKGSLRALATYRDPADVPVIARRLKADSYDALRAVEVYPHPAFFPALVKMYPEFLKLAGFTNEMQTYYKTVAAYQTPAAGEILISVLKIPDSDKLRDYHVLFAFDAALVYRQAFTDVLFQFFEAAPLPDDASQKAPFPEDTPPETPEKPTREEAAITQLWQADPTRTLRDIKMQLSGDKVVHNTTAALEAMIRVLLREMKPAEAFTVLNEALAKPSNDSLEIILKYITRYKPESSLSPLFDRLTREADNDSKDKELIVRTLLAYQRPELRERLKRLLANGTLKVDDLDALKGPHKMFEADE